jgi:hypothetical protein
VRDTERERERERERWGERKRDDILGRTQNFYVLGEENCTSFDQCCFFMSFFFRSITGDRSQKDPAFVVHTVGFFKTHLLQKNFNFL